MTVPAGQPKERSTMTHLTEDGRQPAQESVASNVSEENDMTTRVKTRSGLGWGAAISSLGDSSAADVRSRLRRLA